MNELIQTIQQIWSGWGQTIIMFLAAVEVWLLSRVKSLSEIRKLKAEAGSQRAKNVKKLVALIESRRSVSARLQEQQNIINSAVQSSDAVAAATAREATQRIFLMEYIGAYLHFTSLGSWVFPEARHELIDDEIIPFLKNSVTLLESLNQPAVLSLTRQPALVLGDPDFNFAFRFARKHTRFWETERKRKLAALEGKLLKRAA